ncbi:MAG: OmpA family protein [Sphingomonadaceae bacterium]|nr:OmpA family protein [Sphingomonadaceae bacterium]
MKRRLASLIGAALLVAGCATERVVLLPGEPGRPVGALAVINEDGSDRTVLADANSGVSLAAGKGALQSRAVAPTSVETRYGQLIADLPPPSKHFTLNFDVGEATPGPDQEATLQQIFQEAHSRAGAEVQVVGHTDTLASMEFNDKLSEQRAEQVRDYLISRGLPPNQVRATWRGEREPLVPTPDNTSEPRNRRVEVIVR